MISNGREGYSMGLLHNNTVCYNSIVLFLDNSPTRGNNKTLLRNNNPRRDNNTITGLTNSPCKGRVMNASD